LSRHVERRARGGRGLRLDDEPQLLRPHGQGGMVHLMSPASAAATRSRVPSRAAGPAAAAGSGGGRGADVGRRIMAAGFHLYLKFGASARGPRLIWRSAPRTLSGRRRAQADDALSVLDWGSAFRAIPRRSWTRSFPAPPWSAWILPRR
jgi:hypothetical protein